MKEIFDIKRFGKYFMADLREGAARYTLSFLLISLMGVVIYAGTIVMGLIINGAWGGPSIYFRATVFVTCIAVLLLTMPSKLYGHLTEKRAGTTWLMIPASIFEKYLSMILICAVIIPALFLGVYIGTDSILCAVDKTCGVNILHLSKEIFGYRTEIPTEVLSAIGGLLNPLTYIDDIIGSVLIFLLGAICFRNAKVVKTILFLMVISMAFSIIASPFITGYMETLANNPTTSLDEFFNGGFFGNLTFIDTINDLTIIAICLTGIFFRLKTLKH